MMSTDAANPTFVRLAAHPLRWRLLTELAESDRRVRELVDVAGQPQSLISYHLRLLRGGGLVTAHRSSFDARDSYYHLDLDGLRARAERRRYRFAPCTAPRAHPTFCNKRRTAGAATRAVRLYR